MELGRFESARWLPRTTLTNTLGEMNMATRTVATHYVCGFYYTVWYERGSRSWTVQATDGNGNQVGDTQSAPTRDMACIYLGMEAENSRNTHQNTTTHA